MACDDRARSNRACPPARLLLVRGDAAAAARWTQEHGLGPEDKPGYPQELEYLVLARVLVALGRPDEARALLDRLGARAAAQDRTGSVVEIQALQALALAAGGDGPAAADTLAGGAHPGLPTGPGAGLRRRRAAALCPARARRRRSPFRAWRHLGTTLPAPKIPPG
jgi:hypothetical protein